MNARERYFMRKAYDSTFSALSRTLTRSSARDALKSIVPVGR